MAVGVSLALFLAGPAAGGRQRPYVLTAVANIGTVYWRYDCVHYRSPEWSLGIGSSGRATTWVTFRAGRIVRRRTLPAHTVWFPFRRNRVQSLSFVQATEPGTLRARLTVDWRGGSHCESYFPPGLTLQLFPR